MPDLTLQEMLDPAYWNEWPYEENRIDSYPALVTEIERLRQYAEGLESSLKECDSTKMRDPWLRESILRRRRAALAAREPDA